MEALSAFARQRERKMIPLARGGVFLWPPARRSALAMVPYCNAEMEG